MDLRAQIIEEARKYLGVRWFHQGRTMSGIDCVGLIVKTAGALDLFDYDTTTYNRRPRNFDFLKCFHDAGLKPKKIEDMQEGDILVFKESSYPCHTGFVSKKNQAPHIIHAHLLRRKVIEEPFINPWVSKAVACFEFQQIGSI